MTAIEIYKDLKELYNDVEVMEFVTNRKIINKESKEVMNWLMSCFMDIGNRHKSQVMNEDGTRPFRYDGPFGEAITQVIFIAICKKIVFNMQDYMHNSIQNCVPAILEVDIEGFSGLEAYDLVTGLSSSEFTGSFTTKQAYEVFLPHDLNILDVYRG